MSFSDKHFRKSRGDYNILVLSDVCHRRNQGKPRVCAACGDKWTCKYDEENETMQVWRNDKLDPDALLDRMGNDVAVECCTKQWTVACEYLAKVKK